jgi:alkylation response protein AidB-like acyl-CoA dehydrogenase
MSSSEYLIETLGHEQAQKDDALVEAREGLAERLLQQAHTVARAAADHAATHDGSGAFPCQDLASLGTFDLMSAPLPTALGGAALGSNTDTGHLLLDVLRTVAAGSLPLGRLFEGHVNAVALTNRYGNAANQACLAEEIAAGRMSAVWMAGAPLILKVVSRGRYQLQGKKILCSGAGFVRRPLVAAELPAAGGSVLILPDLPLGERADTASWTPLGMRPTATGDVDFTGIEVTDDDFVGVAGDYLRSPYFQGGAWRVLAVQLGGVQAILRHYREQLTQSPHAEHPLQLARYGQALIAAETAARWVSEACRKAEAPYDDASAVDAYVNLARNAFEQAALIVVAAAQKAIGLNAFLRPNPLERIIRDLSTYLRQPALDPSLISAAAFHLQNHTEDY